MWVIEKWGAVRAPKKHVARCVELCAELCSELCAKIVPNYFVGAGSSKIIGRKCAEQNGLRPVPEF